MRIKYAPYPLVEIRDLDSQYFWLFVPLKLVEASFLLDQLPKNKCEQLLIIPGLGEVLSEALRSERLTIVRKYFDLRTLSRVFLIDIFCALTKLPTATDIARSISSGRTYSLRAILALASAMRIMLSRCRIVMGYDPVAIDSRRRSAKRRDSFSWSIS